MPTKIIKIATSHKNFLDWKNGCVLQITNLSKGNGKGGREGGKEWKGGRGATQNFHFWRQLMVL